MIVFLLCIMIAILLFGARGVFGALRWVFGLIVALLLTVYVSNTIGVDPGTLFIGGFLGLCGLAAVFLIVEKLT